MRSPVSIVTNNARALLMGTTVLAGIGSILLATVPAFAQDTDAMETVTVTGYRASLADSTNAKRASIGFSDAVFAEDIGKFPDTNIAESLNRIPGVSINRDIDGEGVNVSIRGLGTNFTKILLNDAQVAIASTGATDSPNTNREVDLNMFPTELFAQLTVSKSPTADMIEGGAAGTINMRSARPFDNPGLHISYNLQGNDYSNAKTPGERGSLIFSDTEGQFGVLVGIAGVHNNVFTTGFEDGNAGWVTPTMSATQCGAGNTCDTIGGNAMGVPATVPNNVTTGGLIPGHTVDAAYLMALNPGLSINQISNMLVPRLGETMYETGTRDRYNGVASFEYRPTDALHFYLDMIGGRTFNDLDRDEMGWGVRAGNGSLPMIPVGVTMDANNVVTGGTFANAQFFLQARPYHEKGDFFSVNPGMDYQVTDMLHVDVQANASRSHFFRDSPSILLVTSPSAGNGAGVPGGATPPVGGVTATFSNPLGAIFPTITSNVDLNDPANFQWNNGRVNLQDEKRYTFTNGFHADATYGGDAFNVKVGGAFDDVYRNIEALDNSQAWQNAVCGDNPNVYVGNPNTQPSCNGANVAGSQSVVAAAVPGGSYPSYPGLGTGYSAGAAPLAYNGSLIPQSTLASYLSPGPVGFVAVNYAKFMKDSHYAAFDYPNAPFSTASATSGNSGTIDEKDYGFYVETNGVLHIDSRSLKYNAGVRWVETHQSIVGPVTLVSPANGTLLDGGKYPNTYAFPTLRHTYSAFLPSINLVYEVTDDFQVRGSISRSMTRPNPNAMLPGLNFSSPTADGATLGNPNLKPYFSNNIDLGAELYTGGEGYIGVAVFRKAISGFTTSQITTQPFSYLEQFGVNYATLTPSQQQAIDGRGGPTTATIMVTQQINAAGLLTVNGMEWDYVQPLDFMLEQYGLKGFGVNANVTILDQKSSGAAPTFATGVSPYSYNVTGYYENDGVMARMSYVFNDRSYATGSNQQSVCLPSTASASAGCPGGAYLFAAPYGQADFSSSVKLAKFFGELPSDPDLTFDVQNVFHAKLRTYDQFTNATHSYYNIGSVFLLGVRGSF